MTRSPATASSSPSAASVPTSELLASPTPAQLIGLLLVSCSTLLLQVTWTRILSVALWYHFAFLVVSTALLGFGLSGVLLTVSAPLRGLSLRRGLPLFAAGQVTTILLGFALANWIPFAPFSLLDDPRQLFYAPLYVCCLAAPFVFSGLSAALLLSRCPAEAGRIYFCDLTGAGVGCLAVIVVMPLCGGSGSMLACAAIAAGAMVCYAERWARALAAAVLLLLCLAAPSGERLLPVRISPAKAIGSEDLPRQIQSSQNLYTGWNTFSRIDVLPADWGRRVLIDAGTAMTRMPRVAAPLRTLTSAPDEQSIVLRPGEHQSVLVVGSGGGWDVLAALRNDAARVVAVEVNPLINGLVTGPMASFVGHLFSDPRVELHTAEARSFIRRSRERYDVILASHTISNAATASGALSLAENYVVTLEAFADYLAHLTPRGCLWFTRPEVQLPRLVATAREALALRGLEQAEHRMLVFAAGGAPSFYGGLVVSLSPLTASEVNRAARLLKATRLRPLYLPGRAGGDDVLHALITRGRGERDQLYASSPTLLRPATDDKPFFNQRARWSALDLTALRQIFDQGRRTRLALEDQPVAEAVLLLVLIQAAVLAGLFIVAPLLWRRRLRPVRGRSRLLAYFLCLGLGYILVEISLIQRLTLFLGEPVYTFAVVVGSLLLASGAGSLLSGSLARDPSRLRRTLLGVLLAAGALILALALGSPPLLAAALGLPLAARAVLTALLLLPLGLVLGMPFPLGLRQAGINMPEAIPWAWGLNAVASVVGSVGAMILATITGFTGVLLAAAAAYLVAAGLDPARPSVGGPGDQRGA